MNHPVIPIGTYVKAVGTLRSFQNHRILVAFNVRPLHDMNEITSHMLEVVQAHMQSDSSLCNRAIPTSATDPATAGFTANQKQAFTLIKSCPLAEGISTECLGTALKNLSSHDIRAGKPPPGLHLDVVKGDKLIEKLIIDEKKFYLFGRNPDHCDFTIDHQSCSRVHAALVYHRHLKRVFLIDLNSTHGTFLGRIRLEPHKPQQVPIDSTMSFGASTRVYTLREKPQTQPSATAGDGGVEDEELKGLLGLPEEETELDNLTEFNTAHNKRISTLTIEEGNLDIQRPKRKRRSSRVSFSEDEEIINPEDIDPSVGRFRNMVQTAVVPLKKKKSEGHSALGVEDSAVRRFQNFPLSPGLYGDLPPASHEQTNSQDTEHQGGSAISSSLPLPFPNPAPEVDIFTSTAQPAAMLNPSPAPGTFTAESGNEPRKKKYAKEAWPGKKPTPSLLI
ncbi:protein phosphatase 1, regulatory subunit 8a isoform X3 [Silurus meridionalis]|nr:protein phosphatase 1, regulatory subunit 8a isoform X3 [Silurus meridionalis]